MNLRTESRLAGIRGPAPHPAQVTKDTIFLLVSIYLGMLDISPGALGSILFPLLSLATPLEVSQAGTP